MGKNMKIKIDDQISFGDLQLARDAATGDIEMNTDVIARICDDNGIDDPSEDFVSAVLVAWYRHQLANGGTPDTTMEIIAAEIDAERVTGIEITGSGTVQ